MSSKGCAVFVLEMDKKFVPNVDKEPSSDTATAGVNSGIFVQTAIVILYYQ